ncbi:MAG: membrane protein insertion efficiency factor YidD [Pseudomonadota bacterium]
MRSLILILIRVYQVAISPLLGPRCRYYPSCSTYAATALREHGLLRGGRLALWRILRCNPFSAGGVDDVPPACTPCTSSHQTHSQHHG